MIHQSHCDRCGNPGVRLYRRYQTVADQTELLCTRCTEKDQGEEVNPHKPHAIGWYVAAIPTGNPNAPFWGYTSAPQYLVRRWARLPVFCQSPFVEPNKDPWEDFV